MKLFLNAAIVISFFATVAATIWLVWDQREIVLNTVVTALIVFVAVQAGIAFCKGAVTMTTASWV